MKDTLAVRTRLDFVRSNPPKNEYDTIVYNSRIQLLCWIYNDGKLRTDSEMETRRNTINEEVIVYETMGNMYDDLKVARAMLKDIEAVM